VIFLPLFPEEKERLKRLSQDKSVVFALKKLFLNNSIDILNDNDVNLLAADRLAIEIIKQAFHELEIIQSDNQIGKSEENLV